MPALRKWLAACGLLVLFATSCPLEGEPAPNDPAPPAQTTSPAGSELQRSLGASADRRAPLSLVVNGAQKAAYVIAIVKANDDVLVKEADLLSAQVPLPGAIFEDVGGSRYVSLASLAPHVTYRIDVAALALDLQIEPSLLGHSTIAVSEPTRSVQPAKADPSGFLTYSASSSAANFGEHATGFIQAGGGSAASGLFTGSASYANGAGHRGLFAFQRESEERLSRFTVGDEYASTSDLGANVVVVGFGATRHFEFQPDYAYFPTPGLRGTVLSPTSADLYVNGALLRTVQLAPGAFDLSGIPAPPGGGVTQVVLHDAYGNIQTVGGLYYEARQLLRKGLTGYDYHMGFLRQSPFGSNDAYGPFAALGEYRVGLSDAVTFGVRIERTAGMVSGGPQFDVALPIGHISFEAAGSSAFGAAGHAYGAAYDYFGGKFGLSLSAQSKSANYSTASLDANAPRQRSSVRESFGLPISRAASLSIANTTTTSTGQPTAAQLLANVTLVPRRRGLFITLSTERDTGGSIFGLSGPASAARWTFGTQATFLTSRSSDLTFGTSNAGGNSSATLALSKSAPSGPGFGYQIQSAAGANRSGAAQVSYQTQYGDVQTHTNFGLGAPSTSLTLTGGLAAFHQGVYFTRPVSGAYALVNVPGFALLPVFFNNQYAGRTDGRGGLVVPNLSPYYDNRVGIDELRDRLDLSEEKSITEVRPKSLSGVVTEFTIHHFHAYSGHVVVHRRGESVVPVLGRLVFSRAGVDVTADLGGEGQFYVENLEPGKFAATVTTTDGLTCAFQIDLPNGAGPVTSIGTLACEAAP